ncbi:heavy-metal-associated domain-containing protein [Euzebyella marina]|jgi:Cu2+-exporting ATPase|uniref:Heavy-metal-associated domain-containing protein n=1 Tax=Euzebyella marina TaxID=1761453 RepID=A0A3G2L4X2_9FLAO|nr:heavy metal-associated domain-containing protein [Euzebyella marina]AYN67278.1 heavy-metal-associated domain-containing protein [Euzebyella marina]|tara:strand:+ start:151 stop:381 length:231 start_codon:yes stop_codon:yes gene_type:complete
MKKRYEIKGMTCNGCRDHVEEAILNVAGVADVSVDLKNAEATVESQFEVPLGNLQNALKNTGDQYKIQLKNSVEQN